MSFCTLSGISYERSNFELMQVNNRKNLEVEHECNCHRSCPCGWVHASYHHYRLLLNKECPCMEMMKECSSECPGCQGFAAIYGPHTNNHQYGEAVANGTIMNGMFVATEVAKEHQLLGKGLKVLTSIKNGQFIGCFAGEFCKFDSDKKPAHVYWILLNNSYEFRNNQTANNVKGKFMLNCMDSSGFVCNNAAFANARCVGNNAKCYTIICDGLPRLVLVATENIPSGMHRPFVRIDC